MPKLDIELITKSNKVRGDSNDIFKEKQKVAETKTTTTLSLKRKRRGSDKKKQQEQQERSHQSRDRIGSVVFSVLDFD